MIAMIYADGAHIFFTKQSIKLFLYFLYSNIFDKPMLAIVFSSGNLPQPRSKEKAGDMEQSPDKMPLSTLQCRCSQEISNYHRGKLSNEQYCLEIFRRALVDNDNSSWIALQEQFRDNVVYWLRRHSKRQQSLQIDTEQH